MEEEKKSHQAHVLVVPYPAQGHINPMLEFSKRLVSKGIKATLANSKFINKSMHADPTSPIAIESISDGFDEGGFNDAESPEAYLSSLKEAGSKTLSGLIKKLGDSGHPVTALIYDGFLPWALDVAREFGLPGVVFFTQSCAVNSIYFHVQRGLLQLPLPGPTVSLPGMPVLQVSETPSYVGDYGSYPGFFHMVVNQFINVDDADWVLFNSFYELEKEVVDWMAEKWRLMTVGPTLPSIYLDRRLEEDKEYDVNLFKPDNSALSWLDSKSSSSVVYVSFGSMAEVGEEQMEEIAWGLKASNFGFLWVVRESEQAKLPKNFREETSAEKGLVVKWCQQLEVLAHDAIGCFLTHCGLNSLLEALCLGVPIIGVPQWTDQPTNAKFVEDVWKIGIRARPDERGIARREVVEQCIKEIMEGEKGKVISENTSKWKNAAREALEEGGTSDQNINAFVSALI